MRALRLRARLMLAFAGFAVAATLLFGVYALVFMYATEDALFDNLLRAEAARLETDHARSGRWQRPNPDYMQVVVDNSQLPDDIGAVLLRHPSRQEFSGRDGRHYHLRALRGRDGATAWLLAEVSSQLVVRPLRSRVLGLLGWSALALIASALLLGAALARRTAAPLARLTARVEHSPAGDLPRDLAHGCGDDEAGVLARALDALLQRVDGVLAREREFTRDASHELRTPLAVIRACAEQLETEPQLSESGRRQLAHLRQSALQLQQTVTSLLVLARSEHTVLQTEHPSPLLPLLEQVIVEQAPLLDGKPVEVQVDIDPRLVVPLPTALLHVLLSNLVGNAFAHTQAGAIRIDTREDRLRIANPAAALDSDAATRLQQPYAKGEHSDGLGLGLAIVQRLGDRHGLALRVEFRDGCAVASFLLSRAAAWDERNAGPDKPSSALA